MHIGGLWLDVKAVPINQEFIRRSAHNNKLTTNEVEKYIAMEAACWDNFLWKQDLLDIGKKYPDAFTMACIEFAGDLSDDRIYKLLCNEESDSTDNLEFVLQALIGLKDIRAEALAIKIAKNEGFRSLWQTVFEYLATLESNSVEDFFIDFLVNDEKIRPNLTQIADAYLTKR
jgi:hypothetical protein